MLSFILAHHEGAIDPDLLDAIMHRIDTMFGVDGWAAVLILGALILLIPTALMTLYLYYRFRMGSRG